MDGVWISLLSHWALFLMGFVAGAYWTTRPRDASNAATQR